MIHIISSNKTNWHRKTTKCFLPECTLDEFPILMLIICQCYIFLLVYKLCGTLWLKATCMILVTMWPHGRHANIIKTSTYIYFTSLLYVSLTHIFFQQKMHPRALLPSVFCFFWMCLYYCSTCKQLSGENLVPINGGVKQ